MIDVQSLMGVDVKWRLEAVILHDIAQWELTSNGGQGLLFCMTDIQSPMGVDVKWRLEVVILHDRHS